VPGWIAAALSKSHQYTSHRRDVMSTRRRLIDTRSSTRHGTVAIVRVSLVDFRDAATMSRPGLAHALVPRERTQAAR
jgi:hypothetical protein